MFPEAIRHVSLIVRPDSFPSIHAAAALGLASAVLLSRHRLWGAVMLMFALLMAAARVAAGVHWPSDLAGGGLIGLAAAVIIARLHHRCWRRPGLVKENDARRSVV